MTGESTFEEASAVFRKNGGILRTGDALAAGIHPETFYAMRDAGVIERLGWGLYRLTEMTPLSQPDLVTVSKKIPNGVICLLSALALHRMTDQIPHYVYIALPRRTRHPKIDFPPIRIFWSTPSIFEHGIEVQRVDGISVKVYSRERTLADCFKYRNKIGMDVTLEALKRYQREGPVRLRELMKFAGLCRVAKVMRPYLEALS